MPNSQIKAYSDKYNVPWRTVEEFWEVAKEQYDDDYEAISGTVKKMCQNYQKSKEKKNMKESNIERCLNVLTEKFSEFGSAMNRFQPKIYQDLLIAKQKLKGNVDYNSLIAKLGYDEKKLKLGIMNQPLLDMGIKTVDDIVKRFAEE